MKESTKRNWDVFWARKSNLAEVYPNSDRIRKHLSSVTELSGKNILEVGAGTGRDSFYMCSDGARLFLLDYSQNSLKILKENIPMDTEAHPVGGDAFKLPFSDGTFDVVFHQGLLEHFRDHEARKLLRENIRVLKSGGYLVVDVPQRWHIYTVIKHAMIFLNAWFAGWEREFSSAELQSLLRELDVNPVKTYGEWMYPSLFYRMLREAFLRIGIKFPLYPSLSPWTRGARRRVREWMEGTPLHVNTALSIGVIAVK